MSSAATLIPPDRRYRPDEPSWYRKLCRRKHPLRVHGRPRSDRNSVDCLACRQELRRERRARRPPSRGRVRLQFYNGFEMDPVAVERILKGEGPGVVHQAEMYEAVRRLTEAGWSITRTAEQVGLSARSVARYRRRIKEESGRGTTGG